LISYKFEHHFRIVAITACMLLLASVSVWAQSNSQAKAEIRGKILLDSIWHPVVYISHIPTFYDMYTMSNNMIIAESPLDEEGNFHFLTSFLPEKDNLYRLHISKKGAPAASLIIGGKDENHLFFIANNESEIFISNESPTNPVSRFKIEGYRPNDDLRSIDDIVATSENLENPPVSKEFVSRTINEKLRIMADTSSHPIVSLYALYQSNFETTYLENQLFIENYLKKWEDEESTYFQSIRSRFIQEKKSNFYIYFIIGVVFFVMGIVIQQYIFRRRKRNRAQLQTLSIQERKIFQLIQSGKSNKEISEEYNIGLSTVKSHVSNIYTKLNIKSRKEAIDY